MKENHIKKIKRKFPSCVIDILCLIIKKNQYRRMTKCSNRGRTTFSYESY